jgi:predicted CXXCH cytochrome family protein
MVERLSAGTLHGPFAGGNCSQCHVAHGDPARHLKAQDASLCLECHVGARKARARGRSRHAPFESGVCWSCHDPHGAPRDHLLAKDGTALCLSCHEALRARLADPARTVHGAVKDGACGDCHAGHGSPSPALLRKDVPELCGECHADEGEAQRAAHGGYAVAGARCTSCHDPHASARKKLVAERLHPPFADGDCRACHEPPGEEPGPARTRRDVLTACGACHLDAAKEAHAPALEGRCFDCHSPHASPRDHLLTASVGSLCGSCHDPRDARLEAAHAKADRSKGCTACHDAHAAKRRARE